MGEYIVFLLAAYIAAIFATLAGFGSSTLLIPVAVLFVDIKTAVFLVACFHLFNNLFKVHLFFKNIDFKLFRTFGIASIIFAFIGAQCISFVSIEVLQRVLSIFLVSFSVFSLCKTKIEFENNVLNAIIGGCSSGFLAGLIGLGGAIRSMFLISFKLPKEIYIGTAALIAFAVDITRIPTYIFTGVVQDNFYYMLLPVLVVIAYFGVRTGRVLLHKVNQESFQKIVYGALLLVGIKLFFI